MKRYGLTLGVLALMLLGLALTQGMMGGFGPGMMGYGPQYGPGMMGYGMMGGHGMMGMMAVYPPEAQPIPQKEVKARMEAYARRIYPGARLQDFMAFSQNYYAQVVDEKGQGLFELIADRYTGVVSLEPGPNMMWNARFGMMTYFTPAPPHYNLEAARKLAEEFLAGYLPGARVLEGSTFPGYYTFDFGRKEVEGMLSVNAYTGEVWLHTWHGFFLGE
ncbi:peptidase M4 [Thermus antranikianii]